MNNKTTEERARMYANKQTKVIMENLNEILDENSPNLNIWDFIEAAYTRGANDEKELLKKNNP